LSDSDIRNNLSAAKGRQFRAWSVPAGVEHEDLPQFWQESLNFDLNSEDAEYQSKYFRQPTSNVKNLRQLARAGRAETERLAVENAGKRKVVWGVPDEPAEHEDADGRELAEESTEDIVAISDNDAHSTVAIQHPADVELEHGMESIPSDDAAQEIVLESADIEAAVLDVEVHREEAVSRSMDVSEAHTGELGTSDAIRSYDVASESTPEAAVGVTSKSSDHSIPGSQIMDEPSESSESPTSKES
jgi:hypothetical protein